MNHTLFIIYIGDVVTPNQQRKSPSEMLNDIQQNVVLPVGLGSIWLASSRYLHDVEIFVTLAHVLIFDNIIKIFIGNIIKISVTYNVFRYTAL